MPSALDRAHGKHSLCRVPWISAHGKRGRPNTYPLALVPTTHIEDPTVVHDQESAKQLTWHKMGIGYNPERLVHPSDAESGTHFDGIHRQKADEACNVRVALATDGFNPYGMSATPYTCWPVFVIPLNLPPGVTFHLQKYSYH